MFTSRNECERRPRVTVVRVFVGNERTVVETILATYLPRAVKSIVVLPGTAPKDVKGHEYKQTLEARIFLLECDLRTSRSNFMIHSKI